MNNVLSLLQAARASSDPAPILDSDHMLAELLVLHEEMIVQLRLERMGAAGSVEFLTGMIEQHEKTAAMLRAKLEQHDAGAITDGLILITGEASSETDKLLVTKSAEGTSGANSVRNNMTVKNRATKPAPPAGRDAPRAVAHCLTPAQ
jgi:osmotically-inducible protein OsmY